MCESCLKCKHNEEVATYHRDQGIKVIAQLHKANEYVVHQEKKITAMTREIRVLESRNSDLEETQKRLVHNLELVSVDALRKRIAELEMIVMQKQGEITSLYDSVRRWEYPSCDCCLKEMGLKLRDNTDV